MIRKSIFLFTVAFLFISCSDLSSSNDNSTENVVGTKGAIPYLSFDSISVFMENGKMVAKGIVTNFGTVTILPTWQVEAQFYNDSTYSVKLGGNYDDMLIPLDPGQSAQWLVTFSSTSIVETDFPNFRVSDLKGVRQ